MNRKLCDEKQRFQDNILYHYRSRGRVFPWRHTRDPYHILLSEVMLQQTQTFRVEPKYYEFLSKFPTIPDLASAPQGEVLRSWRGLGYNRRALNLHRAAQVIVMNYRGEVPNNSEELRKLPGVGDYTAKAVATFAFGAQEVFIETNIRAVFTYEFFPNQSIVKDKELMPLIEETLYRPDPRAWYYGLMDYGAELKKSEKGLLKRNANYRRPAPFRGSNREVRGALLKQFLVFHEQTVDSLLAELPFEQYRIEKCLHDLEEEKFLSRSKGKWLLR